MVHRMFNVASAVSLTVCLAVLLLAWHAHRLNRAFVEVAWRGRYVKVFTTYPGIAVMYVGEWPGPPGVRAWIDVRADIEKPDEPTWGDWQLVRGSSIPFLWNAGSGTIRTHVWPDGTVRRFPHFGYDLPESERYMPTLSRPLPYWEIFWIPFGLIAGAAAVLPASWLTLHIRRRRIDRRRRRLGLCVACGYDLRASENQCPECGRPRDKRAGSSVRQEPAAT